MSTGTTEKQELTLADLSELFGDMPAYRICTTPPPGTATEDDLLSLHETTNRTYELFDGVLVEKVMSYFESRLAIALCHFIELFLEDHDLGFVVGPDATVRYLPQQLRAADVSFVSWSRCGGREVPRDPIPDVVPEFTVEVLSKSNTPKEMDRKLRDYFEAGVRLVWYAEPVARTVRVYTAVDDVTTVDESGTLDGGDVLPGFELPVRDWFRRAEGSAKS